MSSEADIDPRFSPVFQRGYTGQANHGLHLETLPAAAPAVQAQHTEPLALETPEPAVPVVIQARQVQLREPWTNPFVIVVTALGAAAIIAGVWIIQDIFPKFDDPGAGPVNFLNLMAIAFAVPLAIILGVGIFAGVLLHCANYWAHRPTNKEFELPGEDYQNEGTAK